MLIINLSRPKKLSSTQVLGDFSYFRIFVPLVMKNVFQMLALYRRRGANTFLVCDWLKLFLKIMI